MSELLARSALELAELVRSGELSAGELVQASLRRIDELEPQIHAFTHVAREAALAAAAEIGPGDPRPFAGVPIAIKDNRAVAGMPLTMCSDLFGDRVVDRDSYCVRRMREAGFVIVGKTAMPEMGILPTTESRRFGPTSNPWDLERTPGGSSGGAAAAVAAGMVPLRARQRRRWLDPDPGRLLRARRSQAGARSRFGRARPRAELPRLRRGADAVGGRHGRRARRARGVRAGRRELGPASAGPLFGARGRAARPAYESRSRSAPRSRARRSIRSTSAPRATPPRCWSRSDTTSRRSPRRGRHSTCCPTSPARSGR